jgi:hypothetical protein
LNFIFSSAIADAAKEKALRQCRRAFDSAD